MIVAWTVSHYRQYTVNRAQSGASEGNLFSWYSPKSRHTQLSCSGVLWHARVKVNGHFSRGFLA